MTQNLGGLGKGGLGRGLDEIFNNSKSVSVNKEVNKESDITYVSTSSLKAGAHQPRKSFTDETLKELSASIQNQGIIQPLLVRKISGAENDSSGHKYEIIAGERRFRAAQMINLKEIPVIIREYNDTEAMTIALIENLQRENLNAIEEAEAYHNLKEVHKLSQDDLAEKLGKSRSAVANALRLLGLPSFIRLAIISDEIKSSHGRCLLVITNEEDQRILFEQIKTRQLSVREVEAALDIWKKTEKLPLEMYGDQIDVPAVKANDKIASPEKTEFMQNIDTKLKDKFYKKATIKGDENKGNIKIKYTSPEELQYILDMLSIEQ